MPSSTSASSNECNDKGDEILAPPFGDFGGLLDELAVIPDAIARQVGADVEIEPERGDLRIADVGDADQRAGFRIGLAEAEEIGGEIRRQGGEIALHVAGRDGCGSPAVAGEPRRKPGREALASFDLACDGHGNSGEPVQNQRGTA